MTYNSDFLSQLELSEYEQLNSVPKTMPLIEAEFDAPADATTDLHSAKGIMFALGMTITLIVLSFFQLYSSVGSTPANSKIAQPRKLSASNRVKVISARKQSSSLGYQKIGNSTNNIQILILKNAVSKGKF